MVVFHQAEITPDSRRLLLDVSVSHYNFDQNVIISEIRLDTSENFLELGASEKSIALYTGKDDDGNELNEQHVRFTYDLDGTGISGDDLLFVWVLTTESAADTPCNLRPKMGLRVVYNKQKIYNDSMNYIKTIDNCNPSLEMINFMLRLMAFKMALEAGNYPQAIKYWNEFFNMKYKDCVIRRCGCNG